MIKKSIDIAVREKETIKLYWQEIKKYRATFLLGLVFIPLAAVILDTVVPYIVSSAVGLLSTGDYEKFYELLVPISIIMGVGVLTNLIGYQAIIIHESNVRSGLSNKVLEQILQKDHSFFVNQKIGSLTGKYLDFINGHSALQGLFIMKITVFAINLLLGLFLIWQQTPMLAGLVALLIVGLLIQVRISRRLRSDLKKYRKKLASDINGLTADTIANNSTVKTFAAEEFEIKTLGRFNDEFKSAYRKEYKWHSIEGTSRILVMQIIQIIAIAVIGNLLMSKQVEIGMAIFTIVYLQRLSTQLFALGEILFGYDKIMLQASPMTEILMEPAKIVDRGSKKLIVNTGEIEFDSVTYCYPDNTDLPVLNNFCLKIKPGQKIGVVGYSGAGKTTLTRLLLRFDDINQGRILIDGQDISRVTQKSLRRSISYVPQDTMLFHRSLRENIAYGNPSATDKEIIKATKLANAYEFIEKLPDGLDTIVGERGVKLSGGQRQRVAIARAILKDAPILILDEATSALDSQSESLIQKSLSALMTNRTSLIVAHRLSTISKMDRIIVLDKGMVVEDGTHAELILKNGQYARLWNHQSGGFIEEID